jgi:hypothetical protein
MGVDGSVPVEPRPSHLSYSKWPSGLQGNDQVDTTLTSTPWTKDLHVHITLVPAHMFALHRRFECCIHVAVSLSL